MANVVHMITCMIGSNLEGTPPASKGPSAENGVYAAKTHSLWTPEHADWLTAFVAA
jgi:hypothetical protein